MNEKQKKDALKKVELLKKEREALKKANERSLTPLNKQREKIAAQESKLGDSYLKKVGKLNEKIEGLEAKIGE